MLFATLSPVSSSLHFTFVFFLPSLILSLLFLCHSPLSHLFPPLSYPLFLLPATLISLLCPLTPFPLLCLLSPLSQILLLELKGSTLAQPGEQEEVTVCLGSSWVCHSCVLLTLAPH